MAKGRRNCAVVRCNSTCLFHPQHVKSWKAGFSFSKPDVCAKHKFAAWWLVRSSHSGPIHFISEIKNPCPGTMEVIGCIYLKNSFEIRPMIEKKLKYHTLIANIGGSRTS